MFNRLKRFFSKESKISKEIIHEFPSVWIGIDMDGVLSLERSIEEPIGPPIPLMVERLKALEANQSFEIKIMSPRVASESGRKEIRHWLKAQGLPNYQLTNKKDFNMLEFLTAKGVQVQRNRGQVVGKSLCGLDGFYSPFTHNQRLT